jgi:hypothetical protein
MRDGTSDRVISSTPVRQWAAASFQVDRRAAKRAVSTGRMRVHD